MEASEKENNATCNPFADVQIGGALQYWNELLQLEEAQEKKSIDGRSGRKSVATFGDKLFGFSRERLMDLTLSINRA